MGSRMCERRLSEKPDTVVDSDIRGVPSGTGWGSGAEAGAGRAGRGPGTLPRMRATATVKRGCGVLGPQEASSLRDIPSAENVSTVSPPLGGRGFRWPPAPNSCSPSGLR